MIETVRDSLSASIGMLAVLREAVAQRTEKIKQARMGFEETIQHELLALEETKRALEAEESAVRGMALVEYEMTGDKKPAVGVSVVLTKKFAIDDVAGLKWAKDHGMCLIPEALDVKAVQKMATVTPLPFVTVTEEPSVRIASDLTKALDAAIAEAA